MRTLVSLLVSLLTLAGAPAGADAQDPAPVTGSVIASVEISGLPRDDLSPGLRQAIDTLPGQPLDRSQLDALAARIEGERPDVVAAVREVPRPDGRVHVVFLVARISDDQDLVENINARYTVEQAGLEGVDESEISRELRDEMQALVGRPLDSAEADRIEEKLRAELPEDDVRRRISRGSEAGRIRVVFELTRSERFRFLRLSPSRSKVVYHEDHGWSGVLDIPLGGRENRATLGFVFGNDDDLIEEYSGYRLRLETVRAGTERLGVDVELSRFTQDWRDATLAALDARPDLAPAYDTRLSIDPRVTVAFLPQLRFSAGVSISELEPLAAGAVSQQANAAVAAVGYSQSWGAGRRSAPELQATYEWRVATDALGSDLIYRRHFGHARLEVEARDNTFIADLRLGRITGRAPLFERFSLGDTTTLRGWNKYDLAPAGADRMWHQTVEYRFHSIAWFLDAGSLWDEGGARRIRLSSGFGFHGEHAFLTFGFPLNADEEDDVDAAFMIGVRF